MRIIRVMISVPQKLDSVALKQRKEKVHLLASGRDLRMLVAWTRGFSVPQTRKLLDAGMDSSLLIAMNYGFWGPLTQIDEVVSKNKAAFWWNGLVLDSWYRMHGSTYESTFSTGYESSTLRWCLPSRHLPCRKKFSFLERLKTRRSCWNNLNACRKRWSTREAIGPDSLQHIVPRFRAYERTRTAPNTIVKILLKWQAPQAVL